MKDVLPQSYKPSTARRYLVSIAKLHPHCGHLRMDQITNRATADYVSSRSGTVTNATMRRDLTALSRLLSACNAWGWAEGNPAKFYDRSVIRERKIIFQPPSRQEIDTLLSYAPDGMELILKLCDQTGMRLDEAVTLERRLVDWEARTILLVITKPDRPRTIEFSTPGGDAGPVLAAAIPHLRSPLVFTTRDGSGYARMSSNFLEVLGRCIFEEAKAGRTFRRFRIHDLRHGFAIRWLQSGGTIYDLSRHLGHTSVKTTEIYLRYLTQSQEQTAKGIADRRETETSRPGTETGTVDETGTVQDAAKRVAKLRLS